MSGSDLTLRTMPGRLAAELTGAWCLKPYWGKPTVRNFREGGWKRDHGSRTEAQRESLGITTEPYRARASALPDHLTFYRLDTGERLLTAEEACEVEAEARRAEAKSRRAEAKARRAAEAALRREAEARHAEAHARQAEAQARQAEAEARQAAEAEVARLREELRRRGDS